MNNQIKHRKLGTELLVGMYYVSECIKCGWIGSSGELTEDDAQCLQPVGDDHCWGDTDEIGADRLLELMQSGAFDKPATLLKCEPVAVLYADGGVLTKAECGNCFEICCKVETPLYAEQPAPVAMLLPFTEKVIAKLQRFEACVSDGQDVDIGRHWFELLTELELLRRVQRSPAYWEMTQQGEDALEANRLNTPQ